MHTLKKHTKILLTIREYGNIKIHLKYEVKKKELSIILSDKNKTNPIHTYITVWFTVYDNYG